jgi:hypothetical protein
VSANPACGGLELLQGVKEYTTISNITRVRAEKYRKSLITRQHRYLQKKGGDK